MTQPDEVRDRPLGLFRRLRRSGQAPHSPSSCADLDSAPSDVPPRTPGRCEEHTPEDGIVVHLRMCLACGHVGCCDSSRPQHATAHFRSTGHPVMRSVEPRESWRWCYVHELLG